ncbi:hypothetical protein ROZALSC1DRAFT_24442, partial [Rozella allomycis CSF55]
MTKKNSHLPFSFSGVEKLSKIYTKWSSQTWSEQKASILQFSGCEAFYVGIGVDDATLKRLCVQRVEQSEYEASDEDMRLLREVVGYEGYLYGLFVFEMVGMGRVCGYLVRELVDEMCGGEAMDDGVELMALRCLYVLIRDGRTVVGCEEGRRLEMWLEACFGKSKETVGVAGLVVVGLWKKNGVLREKMEEFVGGMGCDVRSVSVIKALFTLEFETIEWCLEKMLGVVMAGCETGNVLIVRVISFEALVDVHKYHCENMNGVDGRMGIVERMSRYWDDAVDILRYKVRDLFMVKMMYESKEEINGIARRVMKNIGSGGVVQKNAYGMMSVLMRHMKVEDASEKIEECVMSCEGAMESELLRNKACDLLCACLSVEIENVTLSEYKSLKVVMRGMESANVNVRNALCRLVMKPICERYVKSIPKLIESVGGDGNVRGKMALMTVAKTVGGIEMNDVREQLKKCFDHFDEDVRIQALSFVCQDRKSCKEIKQEELELVLYFVENCFLTINSDTRPKIKVNLKRMFERMKKSFKSNIDVYEIYLNKMLKFCDEGLHLGSCYNRLSICLFLVKEIIEFEIEIDYALIWNKLFKCIFYDDFELKENCYEILKTIKHKLQGTKGIDDSFKSLDMHLLNSVRSNDAESIALLIRLMKEPLMKYYKLFRKHLNEAKKDIKRASVEYSLQGVLIVLGYLIEDEKEFNDVEIREGLFEMIRELKNIVSKVMESSAPEGFIIDDIDITTASSSALTCNALSSQLTCNALSSQYLSCYCWRSIKQSNQLAGVLAKCFEKDYEFISRLAEYLKDLLINSTHCGAFNSAVPSFQLVCSILYKNKQMKEISGLIDGLFSSLNEKQSYTRRSGGIPLVLLEILKNTNDQFLEYSFNKLIKNCFEEEEEDHVKIHSMNIIKSIIKESTLKKNIINYISDCMEICLSSLKSKDWNIRNCGMMLFSSLIVRIFGSKKSKDESLKENKITANELFFKFPKIYNLILLELKGMKG